MLFPLGPPHTLVELVPASMTEGNVLLWCQIAGYSVTLLLSLAIVAPMSLHEDEFSGKCILFSLGEGFNNSYHLLYMSWASSMYCHYVLCVGVAVMAASLLQTMRLLSLLVENRDSSFFSSFLDAAGCMVLAMLTGSAGVIVTVGFMTWCQSVTVDFPSCEDVAGETIEGVNGPTNSFYVEMEIVQVGVWSTFASLVGVSVISSLKFLLQHQNLNLYAVAASEEARPLLNTHRPEEGIKPNSYTALVRVLQHWLHCCRRSIGHLLHLNKPQDTGEDTA